MPRAKQRTKDLHERGLATALFVLAEEGIGGLTTRNIAQRAEASVPAIYEVFGDKAGLIREVFFEGFRMLGDALDALPPQDDPIEALKQLAEGYRTFVVDNPVLAQVMFSRPFADFDPTAAEDKAGAKVRRIFVEHIKDAAAAGKITGDPADAALVFFALLDGLASAENAQRLGSSRESISRRWNLGVRALLEGLNS